MAEGKRGGYVLGSNAGGFFDVTVMPIQLRRCNRLKKRGGGMGRGEPQNGTRTRPDVTVSSLLPAATKMEAHLTPLWKGSRYQGLWLEGESAEV